MGLKCSLDLVLCIDVSDSMCRFIEKIKANSINLYSDLTKALEAKHKMEYDLKIRIVTFGNCFACGKDSVFATEFFSFPEQNDEFQKCVMSITTYESGDMPRDGLVALSDAIRSNWTNSGDFKRQVIVVISDKDTQSLDNGKEYDLNFRYIAKDFDELSSWWGNVRYPSEYIGVHSKRLLLLAPDESGWNNISDMWDNVCHIPTGEENSIDEVDYLSVLDYIVCIV